MAIKSLGKRQAFPYGIPRGCKAGAQAGFKHAGRHLERMDGGKFHSVHSATTKAVCAASNKRNTGATGAVGQSLDVMHALGLALAAGPQRWTAMEGGCPIMAGNECIGGVGVAGGNWEFDERVAKEAVAAIK